MFLVSRQKGRDAMVTDPTTGGGQSVPNVYRHPLLQCVSPFLRALDGLPDTAAMRKVQWTPQAAGLAAVMMTLDTGCTLAQRCSDALHGLRADFTRRRRTGQTYNGLLKALVRQAPTVLPVVKNDLRVQAKAALAKVPRVGGWTLLAADGSKEELPRTRDLERHFGIADNGKCPQALTTSVVEVFTGLLWDWRIDKGRGSEKDHLKEMTAALPEGSLLLADGNFVGHALWSAMHEAGRHFLIRVGGNVSLIRDLFPGSRIKRNRDIVYVWPVNHQKQETPLKLRLIKVKGGKSPVYLVTNVFDRRRLSRKRAGKIYRLRWGVELFYRTFKRSLGLAKLRSRSAPRAQVELEWAMVTMSILTLLGIDRLQRRGVDPKWLSPTALIQALRASLLRDAPPRQARSVVSDLRRAINAAVRDRYRRRRPKRSRHRPITTNTPAHTLKPPRIRRATADERRRAWEICYANA